MIELEAHRLLRRFFLTLRLRMICGLVVIAPSISAAKPTFELKAQRLAKEARKAYKNGLYETAANQFSEAFELSGKADYLYDAAISFQQVQRWDQCVGYMGRYLEIAPISPKRDRARNARDNCEARRQQSQTLRIETNPSLANVRLGNQKNPIVGTTPLELKRPPGVLRVFIEKEGYASTIRDVELQSGTPILLSIDLKKLERKGYLFVDSTVSGATVFLNGNSTRLTPFERPLSLASGLYQIQVNRPGFRPATHQVQVDPLTVHHLQVDLRPIDGRSSWRTPVGWVATVLGGLSIAGGVVAMRYADDHYRDTKEFRRLSKAEATGYVSGGVLMTSGFALLIWDAFRNPILRQDRNPYYGQPIPMPQDAVNVERVGAEP